MRNICVNILNSEWMFYVEMIFKVFFFTISFDNMIQLSTAIWAFSVKAHKRNI